MDKPKISDFFAKVDNPPAEAFRDACIAYGRELGIEESAQALDAEITRQNRYELDNDQLLASIRELKESK